MGERTLKIRIYEDDWEMLAICEALKEAREQSRSKRGTARRGVDGELARRMMIAGYMRMYGEFPPRGQSLPAAGHDDQRHETESTDLTTNVAQAPHDGSNGIGEPSAAVDEKKKQLGVDLSQLLNQSGGSQR